MKKFPATHLNKHAKEVFAAAREDGSVVIEHNGYFGGVFAIVWKAREIIDRCAHDCDEKTMICNKCGEQCFRFESSPFPRIPRATVPPYVKE